MREEARKFDKYFILLRGWENTGHYTWQLTLNITYELYHIIKTEDARNLWNGKRGSK